MIVGLVLAAIGTAAGAAAAHALTIAKRKRVGTRVRRLATAGDARAAACGLLLGGLAGLALGDPVLPPLAAALAWGARGLVDRVVAERTLLARTRAAVPLVARVQQEVQAGAHPVAALALAAEDEHLPDWLGRRLGELSAALVAGEALGRAAAAWAAREDVPVLRMFAHLIRLHATWGSDLAPALRRLVREAEASVAFGTEERAEHGLYEALTLVFLALDLLVGVLAIADWPAGVAGPLTTLWGRALLLGSALATTVAVALPVSLAAASPPRLWHLGPVDGKHDA